MTVGCCWCEASDEYDTDEEAAEDGWFTVTTDDGTEWDFCSFSCMVSYL